MSRKTSSPAHALPVWKRAIENVFLRPLFRIPLFRRFASIAFTLSHEHPAPVMDARFLRSDLLQLIYTTDLQDPALRNYNDQARPRRQARPRGPLTMNWVIPDVTDPGSGGHMNIFRFLRYLMQRGHTVRLYTNLPSHFGDAADMQEYIADHYVDIDGAAIILDEKRWGPSDICVATSWDTTYAVFHDRDALFKMYFVQDFEPMFFPAGAHAVFAENTYRMGFYGLCGSPWLKNLLHASYGMKCGSFEFGYDEKAYRRLADVRRDPDFVCAYVRPFTTRRGFELMMGALLNLKRLRPRTRIAVFGNHHRLVNVPFACEQTGVMDDDDLARLYNEASVLLLTSLTNYSIIPIEAMACGALVVDIKGPSIESVFKDREEIVLSDRDPMAMAREVAHYLDHPAEREAITVKAEQRARQHFWPQIFARMEQQLIDAFYA